MQGPVVPDLRVSHVAPAVEDSLSQLTDMVKQLGVAGNITESQNRRMVAYLGNMTEMREQIAIMVQRYEDDEKVLCRLLDLLDRIDEVRDLATAAHASMEDAYASSANEDDDEDEKLAKKYDTIHNPLIVSHFNMLDVSGLALIYNGQDQSQVVEEVGIEDVGDEFWDHDDDMEELSKIPEDAPTDIRAINLSISNINLPSLFEGYDGDAEAGGHGEEDHHLLGDGDNDGYTRHKVVKIIVQPTAIHHTNRLTKSWSSSLEDVVKPPTEQQVGFGWHRGNVPPGGSYSMDREYYTIPIPPPLPNNNNNGASSSSSRNGKGKKKMVGKCPPVLCKICYEEYDRYEKVYCIDLCKHSYCRDCLNEYFSVNIKEGAVLDLMCPSPNCETEIEPDDIKAVCDMDTFARYERFTVIAALRADPNARWCPNPKCNNGIKADPTQPWVYCNACHFQFCFRCLSEKHEGANCGKEALTLIEKRRDAEKKAVEEFSKWTEDKKAFVKPCPTCHSYIEKNAGCNHMTCGNQSCRQQFCWLCLALYEADHFLNNELYPDCYDKQFWTSPDELLAADIYQPDANVAPNRRRRFGHVARKIGIYVGVGVAVVTLGVPAAVIGGPVYGCFQLHKRLKARRRRLRGTGYHDENFVPPSQERIAEAQREVARLRALEERIEIERRGARVY